MASNQANSSTKPGDNLPNKDAKGHQSKKDDKKKDTHLRPSTPPAQTGSKVHDDDGNSPCSQACESGTVTPSSEGVWRKDRKRYHAPPAGDLK
ncbi:hypothetical protein OEA41_000625 [Lepraria neglecta]|uniref:Uncharacterized protein n=1 Tax=Lepraria neglecta TaxID=209136 RepID=A0AAD9ZGL0_9LECA|nr:hypothetical protein OEA41_000625 [Lepraria neglecta]